MSEIIKKLQEQRNRLIAQGRAILDAAGSDPLSPDDVVKYDGIDADVSALTSTIQRHQTEADRPAIADTRAAADVQPVAEPESRGVSVKSEEYRAAWEKAIFRGGTLSAGESRALEAGTDSEGGYLTPTITEARIIEGLREQNFMRALSTVIQVSGKTNIPTVATDGTATIVAEEGTITPSDGAFGQLAFTPYKLTGSILISNELIEDSAFNLSEWINQELTRRLAAGENTYMINGSGSSLPQGWMNGVAANVTASGAAALTSDEIYSLWFSVKQSYRQNSVWLMEDLTLAAVRKLKDTTNQYIYSPGYQGGPDQLFGRPVYTHSDMDAMTSGKRSVVLGDPKWYIIADQGSTRIEVSRERYIETDQTLVKATRRFDSKISIAASGGCIVQA